MDSFRRAPEFDQKRETLINDKKASLTCAYTSRENPNDSDEGRTMKHHIFSEPFSYLNGPISVPGLELFFGSKPRVERPRGKVNHLHIISLLGEAHKTRKKNFSNGKEPKKALEANSLHRFGGLEVCFGHASGRRERCGSSSQRR